MAPRPSTSPTATSSRTWRAVGPRCSGTTSRPATPSTSTCGSPAARPRSSTARMPSATRMGWCSSQKGSRRPCSSCRWGTRPSLSRGPVSGAMSSRPPSRTPAISWCASTTTTRSTTSTTSLPRTVAARSAPVAGWIAAPGTTQARRLRWRGSSSWGGVRPTSSCRCPTMRFARPTSTTTSSATGPRGRTSPSWRWASRAPRSRFRRSPRSWSPRPRRRSSSWTRASCPRVAVC